MSRARFLQLFPKKALIVILMGALVFVGAACAGEDETTPTPTPTPSPTPAATPTATPPPTSTPTPTPTPTPDRAAEGMQLFSEKGCINCHKINGEGTEVGPSMVGLFGSEEELDTGEKVTVDHEYIEESIEDPGAKVVKGYQAIMPQMGLSHDQIDAVIDFIKSLAN